MPICIILFSCNEKKTEDVTNVKPIFQDGIINISEWQDAKNVIIDNNNSFYLKEDESFYYLAVKSTLTKPLYVDMFFQINDSLFNIHASSQLGDRYLSGKSWTDLEPETLWGQNKFWNSNIVQFDKEKIARLKKEGFEGNIYNASFIPYDGFEFRFSKSHWNINTSKLRIEIRNMVGPDGFADVIFPKDTERKNPRNWYAIE